MANKNIKKSKGDKDTLSLKKEKKKKQEENVGYDVENDGTFEARTLHGLRVAIVILVIFLVFYFITVLVTGYSGNKSSSSEKDTSISYTNTVVGRSFSMPEEEYLILYYDNDDENLKDFGTLLSTYRSREDAYVIYNVDMGDSFNKSYSSDSSNSSPSSVSDLSINGPTLIHFKDHTVVEYIEGQDSITSYLQ